MILALRKYTVGSDTGHYVDLYNSNLYSDDVSSQFEFGYYAFTAFLNYLHVSSQGYLIISSGIIVFAISYFIYKYAQNIPLSFFLYLTIGLFQMNLSGVRQSLSIAILLFSFSFVFKRKLIPYLLLLFLATTVHKSSIIFAPMYFLCGIKINSKFRFNLLLLIPFLVLIFAKELAPLLQSLSYEKYLYYMESHGGVNIIYYFVIPYLIQITVIVLWTYKKKLMNNFGTVNSLFYFSMCFSTIYYSFFLVTPMISRLVFYFSMPLIVLIANSFMNIEKKYRYAFNFVLVVVCLLYFFISVSGGILRIDNYKFFFQY